MRLKSGPMRRLSLKLPPALDRELAALARRRCVPKSALVREALARYLSSDSQPSKGSFLKQARRLAGCVEGPSNLSSGAEHLRDYGR